MMKRLGTVQAFTLTASSQASVPFGSQTYRVRVTTASTGDLGGCYILFGDSTGLTISSTNGHLMPPRWSETFDVTPGQTFYTVEYTTTHGNVTVSELS